MIMGRQIKIHINININIHINIHILIQTERVSKCRH